MRLFPILMFIALDRPFLMDNRYFEYIAIGVFVCVYELVMYIIILETQHSTEYFWTGMFTISFFLCHLYLGATPSVQAIGHQMGTFLIHLYSKLQCYHLHAWLGAVALTVLFGELSCRKSLVSPDCA